MTAERRARTEAEELRQQLQALKGQDADRRRPRLTDDEAARKIRRLEETVAELQKNLAAQKQVPVLKRCQVFFCCHFDVCD